MSKRDDDKKIFGICRVGEKGQIVIPKEAREMFDIHPGDNLVVLGDRKKGIAIVKANIIEAFTDHLFGEEEENHEDY